MTGGPDRGRLARFLVDSRLLVALGLGLAVGLANLAKPVHIDDSLYLEIARRITSHPLDPYGGTYNWQQVPQRTYEVSISPPLLSYWFALVMAVGGEDVMLLHASMIPWLLLACWGTYRLGERWAGAGLATTFLVIGGPAVVVGTNLMLDVPLLACVCASVEFLARAGEGDRKARSLAIAAGIAGAGILIKFAAIAVVPVFLVAALTTRRLGPALAGLVPVAALLGWQAVSRSIYGASQVGAGLSFLAKLQSSLLPQTVERTLTMLAILGSTFPIWLASPWRGRRAIGPAVVALAAAGLAAWLLRSAPMNRLPIVTPFFVLAVGLGAFGMASAAWPARGWPVGGPDPRPLLAAWIVSGAAAVIVFGPFVAVRSFLPIEPPLVIWLLSRRDSARKRWPWAAVAASLLLGGLLAGSDFRWAEGYPRTARAIAAKYAGPGRPVVFLGHWGWQYYAERAGFRAWDARWTGAPNGTIVVVPLRADKQWIQPAILARARLVDRITVSRNANYLTTWELASGFRFYGGDFGQLPWGISSQPAEQFAIYEIGDGPR